MFKLFTDFLAFIIQNLDKYIIENSPINDEIMRQFFVIYTLINRIDLTLDKLINSMEIWQRDFYHGSAWSGCHSSLNIINISMVLISQDMHKLIDIICRKNPSDSQLKNLLNYQFRGDPLGSKIDPFDIWMQIIRRNANDYFCGWISHYSETQGKTLIMPSGQTKFFPNVEQRTLFIPNYSLLLTEVQPTSTLDKLSKSQWRSRINIYCQTLPEWKRDVLQYLPEFPAEFPIETPGYTNLKYNKYALIIEVPRQEMIMTEIIAAIKRHITTFHYSSSKLKNTIQIAIQNRIEVIF